MSAVSEHRVLLDLDQGNNERLRVTISPFKGRDYFHIRKWFMGDAAALQPGKGIALTAKQLPQVIAALQTAVKGGT